MTVQKIVIRQYTIDDAVPQPLLQNNNSSNRLAEFAGGTTAECAAVCCCFPLSLVNLLVLAVYGIPAGLCRKLLRKKRRRKLLKKRLLIGAGDDEDDLSRSSFGYEYEPVASTARFLVRPVEVRVCDDRDDDVIEKDDDVMVFENEMWERFYGTGFWRSGSRRVD
uniref:uncharacterized protein LOC122583599 n=1 Tax=Erigeron canadensis TaxID=72917 RepID=UPI001CB8DE56|nr:uncharacterized protein LOC122583599 [Erigeron canadensis]